jgi:hypothetical protein
MINLFRKKNTQDINFDFIKVSGVWHTDTILNRFSGKLCKIYIQEHKDLVSLRNLVDQLPKYETTQRITLEVYTEPYYIHGADNYPNFKITKKSIKLLFKEIKKLKEINSYPMLKRAEEDMGFNYLHK